MGTLDAWGALAASLLVFYCIVINLILLALAGGLWYLSREVRLRARGGLAATASRLDQLQTLIERGEALVVAPFVRTRARIEGIRTARARLLGSGDE